MKAVIKKVEAYIIEDVHDKTFTIALRGKGGPIITEKTKALAKAKFEEALKLSNAVRNLIYFESVSEKSDKDKLSGVPKISNRKVAKYTVIAPC